MFTSYFMSTLEKKVAIVDVEHNARSAMLMQVSKLRVDRIQRTSESLELFASQVRFWIRST